MRGKGQRRKEKARDSGGERMLEESARAKNLSCQRTSACIFLAKNWICLCLAVGRSRKVNIYLLASL